MRLLHLVFVSLSAFLLLAEGAYPAVAPHSDWVNALKPRGNGGTTLRLASGGKTEYSILLPAAPSPQEEKAAADLAQWLGEMTGAAFPVVREAEGMQTPPKAISIGRTELLRREDIPEAGADLGTEGYAVAVRGENLYLLGGTKRGPINAVYALLEEDLGCRWYARGTSTIPRLPKLRFKPVPRRFVPVLEIRDPFYWDAFDGTWSLQNRTNSDLAAVPEEWGGRVNSASGYYVHTFNSLVPPGRYFRDRPDYFSEVNGVRTARQLCMTNPDVLAITIANVLDVLKANPDAEIISVSPNDDIGYCECSNCKAISDAEGGATGPLLEFVNAVADAVKKEYPQVRVSTLAYRGTLMPPKTIRPRENVVIQLCIHSHSMSEPFLTVTETGMSQWAMKAWEAIGATIHIWDYTMNFGHYLVPMPNMPVVAPNIRFYVAHSARGIMLQGNYQSPGTSDAPMRCWVWAKQLWDPSRDTRALMRDFTYGYFGAAAKPMWEYQKLLWRIWREHHAGSMRGISIDYPPTSTFLSKEFLDTANGLFDEAERIASDEETIRRVQLARLPIMYTELSQAFSHLLTTGHLPDEERFFTLLDTFDTIAHREQVTHVAEGGAGLDSWISELRRVAKHEWKATTQKGEATVMRLPAVWKFAPDPEDVGVNERWFDPAFADGEWVTARTDLECGWEMQGFAGYVGFGWYRQTLSLPADLARKHLYLYFAAVDEEGWVYLNGEAAFEHSRASTGLQLNDLWFKPFAFDARTYLRPGEFNAFAVRVYNSAHMGGIWRPVYLVASDGELALETIQAAAEQEP